MKDIRELHLWDYLGIILSRKQLAFGILILCIAAAAVYTFTRAPRYRGSARILIDMQAVNLTDVEEAQGSSSLPQDRNFFTTQLRIITSRPVVQEALQKAGLMDLEEFSASPDPVHALQQMISVTQIRNSRLADISILREDSAQAAQIVNALVDSFIAQNRKRRLGISSEGLTEMNLKAEELRAKLDRKNQQLRDFMQKHSVTSFEHSQRVESERHRALSESISRIEPIRIGLKARVNAAETALASGAAIDSLPDVLESRIIIELKLELARLGLSYADLQHRYGENHPQIQGVDMQMNALRAQIGLISQSIMASLKSQYSAAENEVEYLYEELRKQEEAVARFNELTYEYDLLVKDKTSTETAFDQIIRRIEELELSQIAGQGDNVFVISPAEATSIVSWPSHPKNLLMGAMAGVMLAVMVCFFLEYMDTTVKNIEEINQALPCEVIGTIPAIAAKDARARDQEIFEHPQGALAESIKIIRAALMFGRSPAPTSMVITSTFPEEGKTLVTSSLAVSFAQTRKRVLLVDADLRKPRMHKIFGAENSWGLGDLLTGSKKVSELSQLVQQTRVDNLDFLSAGGSIENPAEQLDSPEFREFLEAAKASYDLVIIDSPPSLSLVDTLVIGKMVDGIITVIRTYSTQKKALMALSATLQNSQSQLLGAIVNNADAPKSGNYMGYYGGAYTYGNTHEAPPAALPGRSGT